MRNMRSLYNVVEGILDNDFDSKASAQIESKINLLNQELEYSNMIADEIIKWYQDTYDCEFKLVDTKKVNLDFTNIEQSLYVAHIPGKFKFREEDAKFLDNCFNDIHKRLKPEANQYGVTANPRNGIVTGYHSKILKRSFVIHTAQLTKDRATKFEGIRVEVFKYNE